MKEMLDSTKDDVKLFLMKHYEEKMENLKLEGSKLKKAVKRASKNVPFETSLFSILLGSFINLQIVKQNSEYYWLFIVLIVTIFIGTLFVIFMSFMDLKKTEKELLKLEGSRHRLYVEVDQCIDNIKLTVPDRSTMLFWEFKTFEQLASKRETYGKLSWSHWFAFGIFSLLSLMIQILILMDTVMNAKNPPTTGDRCCSCSQ